ncbi:hypothetical protein J2W45_000096 [Leifsonia shinshuensis]|nr:hypothetical protein [Leifsonia shinshuensis]
MRHRLQLRLAQVAELVNALAEGFLDFFRR